MPKSFQKFPLLDRLPSESVPYLSEGEYSLHELIRHVALFLGRSRLTITSFSITEQAAREFYALQESGLASDIRCLFDLNVKHHKLSLLFFSLQIVSDIRLMKNHSKIVLFEGGLFDVVIVGSANLNINDKVEAGIISADPLIFAYFKNQIDALFLNALKVDLYDFN
jgi:hypothetical protein